MCNECWTAAQSIPVAAVAGRFAWVAYRDRVTAMLPGRRARAESSELDPAEDPVSGAPAPADLEMAGAARRGSETDGDPLPPDERAPDRAG